MSHRLVKIGVASLATFGAVAGPVALATGTASAAAAAPAAAVNPPQGAPLAAAAGVIGIPVEQLRAELATGLSIAQVAASHGSSGQAVIDTLVAAEKAKLDAAVAAGRITQAQADAKLAQATTRITTAVNTVRTAPTGTTTPPPGGRPGRRR